MMSRAAQTHLSGHMLPAGPVLETPVLDEIKIGKNKYKDKLKLSFLM